MKHLSLAILAAAVAMGLTSFPARADFIVDDKSNAPKPVATKPVLLKAPVAVAAPSSGAVNQGRLIQVGAPLPGPAVEGWADDVPLALALEQIVPKGWQVETGGVDTSKIVSWKGGRSWHAIVGDLAYGYRFDARIDWVDQRLTLGTVNTAAPSVAGSPAPIRKEGPSPAAEVAVKPAVKPADFAPAVKPIAPPAPAVPVVQTWTLDPSKTLRENVEAWTKKAGWSSVVWEGADYPIQAAATFTGAFDSPEGPLAELISAYDGSEQPLLARLLRRDKVVHVTNRNYVPAVVTPTSPGEISPRAFGRDGDGVR